jgi:hypothetical protein
MKKIVLFVILLAAVCQARAQQLFPVNPADSLKDNLLDKYLKIKPSNGLPLFEPGYNGNEIFAGVFNTATSKSVYDNMPIAVFHGYSTMPVAKLEGYDNMPVLKLGDGPFLNAALLLQTP